MFTKYKILYGGVTALVFLGLSALGMSKVFAAPNMRDCSGGNAAILAPQSGATVTGIVQIEGTASLGGDFQYYKLEVAPAGTEAWGSLVGEAREQVVNGQLGVWDSAGVADGAYTIRLRVVDPTGNYCEAAVTNINVQNSLPTAAAVPTPEFTVTPTEAPPIQNAVPTPVPTIPIPGTAVAGPSPTAVRPSVTRTPVPVGTTLGGIEVEPILDAITAFLGGLGRVFVFGMFAMGAIFVLVGVIFFVRRVL